MLLFRHILIAGLLIGFVVNEQQEQDSVIEYNVITLLNHTIFKSMVVVVDNVSYPLEFNKTFPILFSGKAPAARSNYQYAKMYTGNDGVLAEPFLRQPVSESTPHEFFNRTWNTHENVKFPQVYPPLSSIHRIESNLHRDNEIPTLHIVGNAAMIDTLNQNISADVKVNSNLSYLSLHDAFQYQGVEVSVSGRSSRWMPKLSYNLKLKKGDDLYGYRNLRLRALHLDPSYIREQLAYNFIKSVGLVSSEFSYVRVFMNDRELGLFGIIDAFKSNWLSNVFANGKPSYDNGYLYQGVYKTAASSAQNHTSDLSYYDNSTAYADGQYEIKKRASDGKKDNFGPLIDFIKFIADAPTNGPGAVKVWEEKIDVDSFLRSMALEVLVGYSDGYLTSADNYCLYQLPDSKKYVYISSDMDMTLGFSLFDLQSFWSENYSSFPGIHKRPLMNKMMHLPEFNYKYTQLLQKISVQLINPEVTNRRINDIVSMIGEDVKWDQTLPRVGKDIWGEIMNGQIPSEVTKAIGPVNAPYKGISVFKDMSQRTKEKISFEVAVNGPTGHISLLGVKEWINGIHQNITRFFSQQQHIEREYN